METGGNGNGSDLYSELEWLVEGGISPHSCVIGQLYGESQEERFHEVLSVSDMDADGLGFLKCVVENAKA